ncbi:N-formylglutamate amidohydrolase [uncultured Parasphingorhabdus sp.]|uniref:N-formylglutamate amidohydrolase n=1 Tax=uncultured Parasphingorhabdus sp. TaxID=2709694 RepID=UPI002AA81B27|nr:N-formylglutamate amidohydrolase [uncultured Parasphingorhabdus sp.]
MDDDWENPVTEAFEISGVPSEGGVLLLVDHASCHVPDDIDLGIPPQYATDHIAYDPGIAPIARLMTEQGGYLAVLSTASRLIVDLNRYPDEPAVIVERSDGVEIPGNRLSEAEKRARLDRFFTPYHDRVATLIADLKPVLVASLHSFSPVLRTNPQLKRPWDIGIMYNDHQTAPRLALQYLGEEEGLIVGDQMPYSGKDLNATMNRQCETVGQPYIGVEVRQDLIREETGQRRFADILLRTCDKIRTALA